MNSLPFEKTETQNLSGYCIQVSIGIRRSSIRNRRPKNNSSHINITTSDCSYVSQLEKLAINNDLVPDIIPDPQESVKINISLFNGKAICISPMMLPISLAFGQKKIDEMK